MFQCTAVTTNEELLQVIALQKQNLRGVHTALVEKEQGFVTVTHTLAILRQMHEQEPSVIVKDNDLLAGYALVATTACSAIVPELFSLFEELNKLIYKGRPLAQYRFYVVGQICVARAYRGKGVFDLLYNQHRAMFQHKYDFVITEIATRNTRSLRAHERVGFKTIHIHTDALDEWAVVLWDFTGCLPG
jgi:GNAT superfamily N-acetyltransferase